MEEHMDEMMAAGAFSGGDGGDGMMTTLPTSATGAAASPFPPPVPGEGENPECKQN
jgi:hypothetical protein